MRKVIVTEQITHSSFDWKIAGSNPTVVHHDQVIDLMGKVSFYALLPKTTNFLKSVG